MRTKLLVASFLITLFSIVVYGQKTVSVEIDSVDIGSDRSSVVNSQGEVFVYGRDENGKKLFKDGINGMFGLSGAENCGPCQKGTVFSERNQKVNWNWITEGGTQTPHERTHLSGRISHPTYSIPVYQIPSRRPLVKFVPFTFVGEVRISDCTSGTSCTNYEDERVRLDGFMRVEFVQTFYSRSLFEWRSFRIVAQSSE